MRSYGLSLFVTRDCNISAGLAEQYLAEVQTDMDEEMRTVSENESLEDFYAYLDPQTVSQAREF